MEKYGIWIKVCSISWEVWKKESRVWKSICISRLFPCLVFYKRKLRIHTKNQCIARSQVKIRLNEFKGNFFSLCKITGYKHFGFLLTIFLEPYYIALKTFAKKTTLCARETWYIVQCTLSHLLCHQPILWCGFLASTKYVLNLRLWNMACCPNKSQHFKHFFYTTCLCIYPWTWQMLCHQPISCHGLCATTENWTIHFNYKL